MSTPTTNMTKTKKIALVGHCGPDASYLKLAVMRAVTGALVVAADDEREVEVLIQGGVDLLLLNRQLDYGFETSEGIELIRQLRAKHPHVKTMLISNYPEAQQAAVEAGALPGFGKREIGSPRVTDVLREALGE
jgi:hypothetical protein